MADKGGIQLLPETKRKIDIKVPGENRLFYAGLAAMTMVGVLFLGLNSYSNSLEERINQLDTQLTSLNNERDKETEEDLRALDQQTDLVSQLLSRHLFWTKAFSQVENSFQQQIQLNSFSASAAKKEIVMAGLAANYTAIAQQISSLLANDGVIDVDLNNIKASNTGKMEFIMKVIFDEDKFLIKSNE